MDGQTLPWYVAGPLIGLVVPLLLWVGNRPFGNSSNLRHICAMCGASPEFFRYDWRRTGLWNLAFVAGTVLGAFVAVWSLPEISTGASDAARATLAASGVRDLSGLVPSDIFSWAALGTARGLLILVLGGFLVGFGTAWGGGCTSGHAITGLATWQLASLIATCSFFAGGVLATWVILPQVLAW